MARAVVEATFRSKCAACGDTIERGDPIVIVDDDWIHVDCSLEVEDDE